MMRRTICIAAALLAATSWAHKDRMLSLTPAGTIPELPKAYSQTRVHIAFAKPEPSELTQLKFVTSGGETDVRPCVLKRVPPGPRSRVKLFGSWRHDERNLPAYVNISFTPSRRNAGSPERVEFLFSLKDGSLLQVTEAIRISPKSVQDRELKLIDGCPAER